MRTCQRCLEAKPLDQFARSAKAPSGVSKTCLVCVDMGPKEARARRRAAMAALLVAQGGKRCRTCGDVKPVAEFGARPASADGYVSSCHGCVAAVRRREGQDPDVRQRRSEAARAYYARQPEEMRRRAIEYRSANPEKARATERMTRLTRRREKWFDVLSAHFNHPTKVARFGRSELIGADLLAMFEEQRGLCYWLGIPMMPSERPRDPRQPSVDRLDNTIGYVRGNVVLTCQFANMGRSVLDAESFRAFVQELRRTMPRL